MKKKEQKNQMRLSDQKRSDNKVAGTYYDSTVNGALF